MLPPIAIEARPETRNRLGVVASLLRDRTALVGLVLVSLFAVIGCIAPLIVGHDPNLIDAVRRLEGPSRIHPFGTDNLGRDTFSRIVYGARWSLGAVAIATALIMSIGVTVGTLAGYCGGLIDDVLMRVVDVLLAFPSLLLAIAIAGMLGPGMSSVIIALVSVWWASYARIVRGMVLSIRHREFVSAAKSLGAGEIHIVFHHVLPNILAPVAILATVEMGELILAVAGLGFLGIGVQPPAPEWGTMVNDGRSYIMSAPQLMMYPGLAISLSVIGFNLLGDGLRDILDPRTTHRHRIVTGLSEPVVVARLQR